MSEYHTIIREQAGIPVEVPDEAVQQQELKGHVAEFKHSMKLQWLSDDITATFFKTLSSQIGELETQARLLACAYHRHNNHQEIIHLLVRAEELRKLIKTYGTASHS